jgi:hypothetical protein
MLLEVRCGTTLTVRLESTQENLTRTDIMLDSDGDQHNSTENYIRVNAR